MPSRCKINVKHKGRIARPLDGKSTSKQDREDALHAFSTESNARNKIGRTQCVPLNGNGMTIGRVTLKSNF